MSTEVLIDPRKRKPLKNLGMVQTPEVPRPETVETVGSLLCKTVVSKKRRRVPEGKSNFWCPAENKSRQHHLQQVGPLEIPQPCPGMPENMESRKTGIRGRQEAEDEERREGMGCPDRNNTGFRK
jgi:hypothetical protein